MMTDRMDGGGAETHIATLMRELDCLGVETALLSEGGRMAESLGAEGYRSIVMPRVGRDPFALRRAASALRRLQERERYHVLHAHARIPARILGVSGSLANRPNRLVTVHAAYPTSGILPRFSYWGDQTIAVSEDLRARVCDGFGVPAQRVTVIPNGINCSSFQRNGRAPTPTSILFASRLDRDCSRAAELLLELALPMKRVFPTLTVTFAGGGSEQGRLRARGEAIQREAGERFLVFLGHAPKMEEVYQRHQIFVGVSRAALEASACGCAVVLCGNEGFGGFLTPENPIPALSNFCCRGLTPPTARLLASHLAPLLAHPLTTLRLANHASAWVRQRFSSRAMAEAYLRFVTGS